MKFPALGLILFAGALAVVALSWPGVSSGGRKVRASANVSLQGPTVVVVRDLPRPKPGYSSAAAQALPRIPAPHHSPSGAAPVANVIDTGAGVASAPGQSSGFEGLSNSDNLNLIGLDLTPPDTQIAVGPDHIVELINGVGRVFDRTGRPVRTFPLSSFFAVRPGHQSFDPKIVYDSESARWFASFASRLNRATGPDEGGLYLAVSLTSDPTGGWSTYTVPFNEIFPDQPGLGLTDDKVTLSSNMVDVDSVGQEPNGQGSAGLTCPENGGYCGEQTIVFQKSALLTGAPADHVGRFAFGMRKDRFTVRPAHSLSPTNDQYLAAFSFALRSRVDIIRVSGTPDEGNVIEAKVTELPIHMQLDAPPSITAGIGNCVVFDRNLGPPPCVDSGDFRLLEAIWRDNHMWLAAPAACQPPGDTETRACAHLIEVATDGTPAVRQDILFGAPGEYYSWPAIRTDAAGDLIVALTHADRSIFAELRVAGRRVDDPLNTMGGSTLIKPGEAVHTSGRWGDYLGAAVDPLRPNCVWIAGEYAKVTLGRDWSTFISSTGYGDACTAAPISPTSTSAGGSTPSVTPSVTPTRILTGTPTSTRTPAPTFTATPPRRYGDVSCDNNVNSVDAALVLQFSAGLIDVLSCPQNADVNNDGMTNALDALLILQLNAGLLPLLPP